jgi:hypothetical protein
VKYLSVGNFADLMHGHASAEIINPRNGQVVRRLTVRASGVVHVDAFSETVDVDPDTAIVYEPWFMDRGSLLFNTGTLVDAKICTELDIIQFPDGTQFEVVPKPRPTP